MYGIRKTAGKIGPDNLETDTLIKRTLELHEGIDADKARDLMDSDPRASDMCIIFVSAMSAAGISRLGPATSLALVRACGEAFSIVYQAGYERGKSAHVLENMVVAEEENGV